MLPNHIHTRFRKFYTPYPPRFRKFLRRSLQQFKKLSPRNYTKP